MNRMVELFRKVMEGKLPDDAKLPMDYPPPIARTIGFKLVEIDEAKATMELETAPEKHANPMGTVHGGVLCDLADAAIGTAHVTTLGEGETFTSVDLKINFFRPVWRSTLRATAEALQRGKTISYYECKVSDEKQRLVAVVTSTVMTLRGDAAQGR